MPQRDPGTTVTDEQTRSVLERIYSDKAHRGELLAHAARFVGQSRTRSREGIDAGHLVSEAVVRVLSNGFPDNTRKPIAYLKKVITNLGLNQFKRHERYKEHLPKLQADHASRHNTPGIADVIVNDDQESQLRRDFEEALDKHPPPVPVIGRALRDHPQFTVTQIAEWTGCSDSTVYRAKKAIRGDPVMRTLLDGIDNSELNAAPPDPP